MSQLVHLRQRLAKLRRTRACVRIVRGVSAFLAGCVILGLIVFAIDVQLLLSINHRLVVLLLMAGALAWVCRRYVIPELSVRESLSDMALWVQNKLGLSSDMIAALQFESTQAAEWGSVDLRHAVIERMAGRSAALDRLDLGRWQAIRSRIVLLAIAAAAVLLVAVALPQHLYVFFQRLGLSCLHYPTQTKIELIAVNQQPILVEGNSPQDSQVPEGQVTKMEVRVSGRLPERGVIRIAPTAGQSAFGKEVVLYRHDKTGSEGLFSGNFGRLLDPIRFDVAIGDARTDVAQIRIVPTPVVEAILHVEPPAYTGKPHQSISSHQVAVTQGSRVQLQIRSVNGKRLTSVHVTTLTNGELVELPFSDEEGRGLHWRLLPGTTWDRVIDDIAYEIKVVDRDGLGLLTPWRGSIRCQKDQGPLALLQSLHRVVLPAARPKMELRVSDDHGIAALTLHLEVRGTQNSRTSHPINRQYPIQPHDLPMTCEHFVDLRPLKLATGDRVDVSIEATDFRGSESGTSVLSDPITIEVSDEAGVLAAVSAIDEKSERELNEIIRQQLGIEETK